MIHNESRRKSRCSAAIERRGAWVRRGFVRSPCRAAWCVADRAAVGWFSRSHLRSACRDALPASTVVRMSGAPMTMRKAIRGHANRVQARARRAAGAKAGRWGRGPDRDPGEGSQVAAARTPLGRVLVSRVRGRDFARALPKRGRSPRAPTEHFTCKRFKISQVIPGRFPTCPSARSGFSLAAPRARGAIASRQIVQA